MLCNIVLYIVLAVDTIIFLSNIHVRIPIMDDTISSFYFNVHMKVLPKNWDTIKNICRKQLYHSPSAFKVIILI